MTNEPHHQFLRRSVRFSINPDGSTDGENSFAGKPSMSGLGRYYEIQLEICGIPDPQTGYLVGIKEIDEIVRNHLAPIISSQIAQDPKVHPGMLLETLWNTCSSKTVHGLHSILWNLTPYYSVEMTANTQALTSILSRQRFEFAAAHRLHSPSMTNEENARFFGKCNNQSGHGHNYKIEPCVRIPISMLVSKNFQLEIQHEVNSILIEQLDHKYLNTDCSWFDQSAGGVIPSVENIARVCFEQLAPSIAELAPGVELISMTAWETEKTSSIYPAQTL
jgi:6-pyruvoyltetrahydropterin/6-carboxytetrahydropterin synthase